MGSTRFDHDLLRRLRLDAGFTQDELAARIGVDVTTLRQYESGRVNAGARGFDVRHVRRQNILHLLASALELDAPERLLVEAEDDVVAAPAPRRRVELASLPTTGPVLCGRDAELAALGAALADPGRHVACIVGWGGTGKSALVNRWLGGLARRGYPGLSGVFGWSFEAQGGVRAGAASADLMLSALSGWLALPAVSGGSVRASGAVVADALRSAPYLLVLDGVEALQDAHGRIGCPGLLVLLKQLAAHNPGLCVTTSRLKLIDVDPWRGATVVDLPLDGLSAAAGREVLAGLGVEGADDALDAAVREVAGHPLSLQLLGERAVRDGAVLRGESAWSRSPAGRAGAAEAYGPALVDGYLGWLAPAELGLMLVLGLFDGRAPPDALDAALVGPDGPLVPGLTDPLETVSGRRAASAALRALQLLSPRDPAAPDALDCHPLVRDGFGRRLREAHPDAWRRGHSRLFAFYRDQGVSRPRSLEAMAPAFAAVKHGCLAGAYVDALVLAEERINQGEHFAVNRLGAVGACLACLSFVFDAPWTRLRPDIPAPLRATVLATTGRAFKVWGRGEEACQLLEAALVETERLGVAGPEAWELVLSLADAAAQVGRLARAEALAHRALADAAAYADGDGLLVRHTAVVILASVAAARGEREPAERAIEGLIRDRIPLGAAMTSGAQGGLRTLVQVAALQAAVAVELAVWLGRPEDAVRGATWALEALAPALAPVAVAVGSLHTAIARAPLALGDLAAAQRAVDLALHTLRRATFPACVARALCVAVEVARATPDRRGAEGGMLDEALEIAVYGGYRPIEAEVRAASARALRSSSGGVDSNGS